jgi:hypothetical protein
MTPTLLHPPTVRGSKFAESVTNAAFGRVTTLSGQRTACPTRPLEERPQRSVLQRLPEALEARGRQSVGDGPERADDRWPEGP